MPFLLRCWMDIFHTRILQLPREPAPWLCGDSISSASLVNSFVLQFRLPGALERPLYQRSGGLMQPLDRFESLFDVIRSSREWKGDALRYGLRSDDVDRFPSMVASRVSLVFFVRMAWKGPIWPDGPSVACGEKLARMATLMMCTSSPCILFGYFLPGRLCDLDVRSGHRSSPYL